MKQKYPLFFWFFTAGCLLIGNKNFLQAQNANPLVHSVQYTKPDPDKVKDILKDATEDVSKRTLFSSTWITKSGAVIEHYSKGWINYPDSNGKLQPIDLTLHSDPRGWVADKQPNPCYFHSDRSTTINLGGKNEITFNKNCTVNGMPLDQQITSLQNSEIKIDLSEGVHKKLTFINGGVETDYIFDRALDGGATVTEELEIPAGCTLQKDEATGINQPGGWSGDYQLMSADGKVLAIFMAPECYDAKKHWCFANYSVELKDGKTVLVTSIPNEWLANAVYPVTLDPKVVGATSYWTGGSTVSCLYPNFHTDSILVTIPPKITIYWFTIDYAYVSNVNGRGIPLNDGLFYLSTPCARTDTLRCLPGDTAGICYLVPWEDFHSPYTCCFSPSCSPQTFWVDAHLSRFQGGFGCDSTTIWYSAGRYTGFQYYFSAWMYGYTDSVTSLTYTPSSQCSNSCTINMNAVIQFGVPPYKVSHPWAARDTIVGRYSSCASQGIANMKLTIPGVNCPFVCLSPDTTITVPPPTVVDACGDTVKNIKPQTITLKPIPVLSITPDTNKVCSGLPVTLNIISCVPGTTFNWAGNDLASGTGSTITDNTADTGITPMVVTYKVVGNANGCNSDTIKATGIINPYPIVTITGTDTLSIGHSEILSTTAPGGCSYYWTPATGLSCNRCPNPVASPTVTTTYTLDVIDSEGCEMVKTFTILVLDNQIIIPNVITPNGDNKNDLFVIRGLDFYPNSQLTIYDRWGKKIYTSSNYQNNWDGSGQSDGVYYYVFVLPTGKKFAGYIQIIK